jgi:hypothetical protein
MFLRRIIVVNSVSCEQGSGSVDRSISLLTPFYGVTDRDIASSSRRFSRFSYLTLGPLIVKTTVHRHGALEVPTDSSAASAHQRAKTAGITERLPLSRDGLKGTLNRRRSRRRLNISNQRRPANGADTQIRSERPSKEANRAVGKHPRQQVDDSGSDVGSNSDDSPKRPEEVGREMSTTLIGTPLTVRIPLAHEGIGSVPVKGDDPRVLATEPSIQLVGSGRQKPLPWRGESEGSLGPKSIGAWTGTSTTLLTNGNQFGSTRTVDGNGPSDYPSESFSQLRSVEYPLTPETEREFRLTTQRMPSNTRSTGGSRSIHSKPIQENEPTGDSSRSFSQPIGVEQPLAPEAETGPRLTVRKTPSSLENGRTEQEGVNQSQSELDGDFDKDFSSPMTSSPSRPIEPQIDVDHLTDQMYDKIQRKMRIERERRGF